MPRWTLLIALLTALAGCGDDGGAVRPNFDLTTPGPEIAAQPIDPVTGEVPPPPSGGAGRPPSADERARLEPLLRRWGAELTAGDTRAAAQMFRPPVVVFQSELAPLGTAAEVRAFHEALPCGARLLETRVDGRYVLGRYRLTARRGSRCTDVGEELRIAFVLKDRRFTEWWQLPARAEARPAPSPSGSSDQ